MAHGLDDLDCEAGAADQVAAIFVGALIGAGPEELVDQIAMGAVDLDAVESKALRVRGGLSEGLDDAADMLARHRLRMLEAGLRQAREAGHGQARRPGARQLRMGRLAGLRAMPTCQSCGMILPPAACTASTTRSQPSSAAP